MKLELKKFNPNLISNTSTILALGKRSTGKSVLIKDLLSYNKNIPVGVVISPTEQSNQHFEKFIPKMLIYDEYSPEITKKFLERQIKINEQHNLQKKKTGTSDIDPKAFFILDDCLYDKSWINDKSIRSFFLNGRHYNIFFLITLQYALGIPPIFRSNIDYVFIFRNNIVREQEKIYNYYAGMFPTFEMFQTVLMQCTENYECLVIDNKIQSNKLVDQIYWYKANVRDFKMCNQELWDLCLLEEQKKEMNIFNEESDDVPYDPELFVKNRNKIKVNVHKKSS